MERREVLAGVAGVVGIGAVGAYGFGVVEDKPFTLKVYSADRADSDLRCDLPDGFLDDRPVLAELVAEAQETPDSNRASRRISKDRAARLVSDLESACESDGGLYEIQGQWFLIGISGPNAHGHSGDDGHDHSH